MQELRLREVMGLTQGHTAGLEPNLLSPELAFFSPLGSYWLLCHQLTLPAPSDQVAYYYSGASEQWRDYWPRCPVTGYRLTVTGQPFADCLPRA